MTAPDSVEFKNIPIEELIKRYEIEVYGTEESIAYWKDPKNYHITLRLEHPAALARFLEQKENYLKEKPVYLGECKDVLTGLENLKLTGYTGEVPVPVSLNVDAHQLDKLIMQFINDKLDEKPKPRDQGMDDRAGGDKSCKTECKR